jgi:hypothetical protein
MTIFLRVSQIDDNYSESCSNCFLVKFFYKFFSLMIIILEVSNLTKFYPESIVIYLKLFHLDIKFLTLIFYSEKS